MEARLTEIGIATAEDLARAGPVEAYQRLRAAFGAAVTLNALYAMEAAIDGVDWRTLAPERRAALRRAAGAGEALGAEI